MLSGVVQERQREHQKALARMRSTAQEADTLLSIGEFNARMHKGLLQPASAPAHEPPNQHDGILTAPTEEDNVMARYEPINAQLPIGQAWGLYSEQHLSRRNVCAASASSERELEERVRGHPTGGRYAMGQQHPMLRGYTLAQEASQLAHNKARSKPCTASQWPQVQEVRRCPSVSNDEGSSQNPIAVGALAEMDFSCPVPDIPACTGPWYLLSSMQSSSPLCSETELRERHGPSLLCTLHTDAACAQIAALSTVPAFAACLTTLRSRLAALEKQGVYDLALPHHSSVPVKFQSLLQGTAAKGYGAHPLEQQRQDSTGQPVAQAHKTGSTRAAADLDAGAYVPGKLATREEVEAVWAAVAPPDTEVAALESFGPRPQIPSAAMGGGPSWHGSRLLFLGTGSSEPSKYRAPTGILLQVRFRVLPQYLSVICV
jgi:hypothetical protein